MVRTKPRRSKRIEVTREGPPDARAILEAAGKLLVEEGPGGLTMRRLAAVSGTSTMVLYTRFGSREAVMEALLAEGFSRFADVLGSVSMVEPLAHLRELGRAYRRFGLENPTAYRLMWGGGNSEVESKRITAVTAAPHAGRAFGALLVAVTRVLALQDRSAREAEPLAMCVWSTVHGFVSLELCGGIPQGVDVTQLYERTLDFVLGGLLAVPPR